MISDYPYISAIYREYDFSASGGTYNANVYLHYENSELAGNVKSTMKFWYNNGSGWTQGGSSGYDATNNNVDSVGITSFSARYTLCSLNSVYRWTGKVNTDWNNSGNWSYVQGGNPAGIPGSTDVVLLGDTTFTNQPVISQVNAAKTILFYSTTATTLTLASGGTLNTGGNILGFYSGNVNHNINIGNQDLNISGNLVLSDGTANHTINISAASGNISVGQSLNQTGGAKIILGSGNFSLFGDYNYTSGTYAPGTGTFIYNGTMTQIVAGLTYNNVTINKTSGTADVSSGTPIINGDLTLTSGEFTFETNTTVAGNVTIGSGSILNGGSATLNVGGNWVPVGTFSSGSSTVNFNGSGNQSIAGGTFNNFNIGKPAGTATLTGNISIEGNISINSGTFDLVTYTANRTSLGGSFSVAAYATLNLAASNLPGTFSNYSLDTLSTVNYNGGGSQTIAAITYGNLTLTNGTSNAKSITSTTTVNGNLTINSGATLNGSSYSILLGGNWTNSGTFTCGTSTVILNGNSKTLTGPTSFYKVTVYGSYSVASNTNITYNGLLYVTTGASYDAGSGTGTVVGDLTNSGTLISSGTTIFTGTQVQTIRLLNAISSTSTGEVDFNGSVAPVLNSTSSPLFATLKINNTGGINPSVGWTVLVNMIVSSGATFNGGPSTHNFYGGFTNSGSVTSAGILNFAPVAGATVTDALMGTSFISTGTVIFGGKGTLTVTGTPTVLKNVVIANSNSNGVMPASDWNVSGNFTIRDTAIFSPSSHNYAINGDFTSNGTLVGGTSTIILRSDTGLLTGSGNTNFNNLTIAYLNQPVTGKVTAVSDFQVQGNFVNNGKLDVSHGTLRFTGTGNSTITGTSTDTLSQIDVAKTGSAVSVTLGTNVVAVDNLDVISGTLDISTYSLTQDGINGGVGTLSVRSGATLKIGGTNSLPAFASGTFDSQSTVWYYGTTQTIASRIAPFPYGNLTISGSGTTTAAGPINTTGNFTLSNSTFTLPTADTLGGNWSMTSGSLVTTGSTVVVNGTAAQTFSSTGALNSLTLNKSSGSTTLLSNLTLNGTLNFTKGILTTGTFSLISTTGSVSGAAQSTGWINGNQQDNYTVAPSNTVKNFAIGDATYYIPVSLKLSGTGTGSVTAKTTATEHPNLGTSKINGNNDVNRYWTLTPAGITVTSAAVTPTWVSSDLDKNATTGTFGVGVYNSSSWAYPATSSPTATSINASSLTSLGDIAVGFLSTVATWVGGSSGAPNDWNTAANWSPVAVPVSTTNVIIPTAASYPVITGTSVANGITLNNPSSNITITGKLQVYGNITNSGTITATAGTVEMTGSTGQTISPGTFASKTVNDFIISNTSTSGVTLADSLYITDSIGFGNVNNAVLNTGGLLVIHSTAAKTGRIADATHNGANSGNTISGNVIVERYIPSNNVRGYRFLASSVNSTSSIHANWQEGATGSTNNPHPGYGTHITGSKIDQNNGFDGTQSGNPSFYRYDVASNNFINFPNTNVLTLHDTTGYLMYFRGDRSIDLTRSFANQGSTSTTLRATGSIVQGSRIYNTNMVGSGNANGGFNLIANPYAAPISWSKIYAANTGITPYYTYFDPRLNGGSYVTVDNTGTKSNPSSNATVEIQSGEAFWIQASTTTPPVLTILESHKSNNNNINVFKASTQAQTFYTSLFINDLLGRRNADGVLEVFDPSYDNNIDVYDADELENFNENIAISRSTHHLSIEKRQLPASSPDTIQLYMSNMLNKNYDLQFDFANIAPDITAQLVDRFTGVKTALSLDTATIVPFTVTTNAASSDSSRFYIVLNPAIILPVTLSSFNAYKKESGSDVEWSSTDELNLDHYEIQRSGSSSGFITIGKVIAKGNTNQLTYTYFDNSPLHGNNFYRLMMVEKNGNTTFSNIVKLNFDVNDPSINIYPNPVTDNNIHLQIIHLEKGNYTIQIFDKAGHEIIRRQISHPGGNGYQDIQINKVISSGIYQLKISGITKQLMIP